MSAMLPAGLRGVGSAHNTAIQNRELRLLLFKDQVDATHM